MRHLSLKNICDPENSSIQTNDIHRPSGIYQRIAVGSHVHALHGPNTTPVFSPVEGEASW